jgi:hypothetical protein
MDFESERAWILLRKSNIFIFVNEKCFFLLFFVVSRSCAYDGDGDTDDVHDAAGRHHL